MGYDSFLEAVRDVLRAVVTIFIAPVILIRRWFAERF